MLALGLIIVGVLVTVLAQLKGQAMMSLAAYEIAQGGHPDLRGLTVRTRGFLPRMTPVIALAAGVAILVYALVFGGMFAAIAAGDTARNGPTVVLATMAGVLLLLFVVVIPLAYYLQTKLLYTIPAVALEQVGGIDGMKRSWTLTRGAFWRTFGYFVVAALAAGMVTSAASLAGQFAMTPMLAGLSRTADTGDASAAILALVPVYLLTLGLQMAVQLLTWPFLQVYTVYMFIDQVRRSAMPPTAPYGYGPPQPMYYDPGARYTPPPQQFPQPGQGYRPPEQGYPAPPQYPQQGRGYPSPGQYPQGWQAPPADAPRQPGPQQPPQGS